MGLKSGGAEFETYLVKFETYSVLRDYETKKTTGAPAPAAPASLAPKYVHTTQLRMAPPFLSIVFVECFMDIIDKDMYLRL